MSIRQCSGRDKVAFCLECSQHPEQQPSTHDLEEQPTGREESGKGRGDWRGTVRRLGPTVARRAGLWGWGTISYPHKEVITSTATPPPTFPLPSFSTSTISFVTLAGRMCGNRHQLPFHQWLLFSPWFQRHITHCFWPVRIQQAAVCSSHCLMPIGKQLWNPVPSSPVRPKSQLKASTKQLGWFL